MELVSAVTTDQLQSGITGQRLSHPMYFGRVIDHLLATLTTQNSHE